MRRTLRIFPVYYALLLLLTLAYLIAAPHADSRTTFFLLLPFYLTYTSNWIPHQAANLAITWSLATEEQFYAVWPTVEKFVRSRLIYVPLAAVIIISQLINFGLLDHFLFDIVGLSPELDILQTTFMAIALGVLAAHLRCTGRGFMPHCFDRSATGMHHCSLGRRCCWRVSSPPLTSRACRAW